MNSRLDDTEEHISELEDRIMESTQTQQKKEISHSNYVWVLKK